MMRRILCIVAPLALAALSGCSGDPGSDCGPTRGVVSNVVDGDTIDLDSGERIRYLMVDTPELSSDDCYADEAREYNAQLVLGREVTLEYDVECTDNFGRLLAYVSLGDTEINSLLVERGYACVLHIPPNGDDRVDEFLGRETQAKNESRGMWGICAEVACD